MRTTFSTADVPRVEAFDYWADAICGSFPGRRKVDAFDRATFSAELKADSLGDIGVASWLAGSARQHVRRSYPDAAVQPRLG